MAKFVPPSDFDFSLPDAWPAWKQRFSRYRMSSRLNSKDEPVQVSMTLYCMGPAAESVFARLKFDGDSDRDKYEEVMAKLDTYFCSALNVFYQRTLFEQCVHQPGETVEEISRKLHDAAAHCNFTDKGERIRDRFVAHIRDCQVARELQQEDPAKLTLTAAVLKAHQAERVTADIAAQSARWGGGCVLILVYCVDSIQHISNSHCEWQDVCIDYDT